MIIPHPPSPHTVMDILFAPSMSFAPLRAGRLGQLTGRVAKVEGPIAMRSQSGSLEELFLRRRTSCYDGPESSCFLCLFRIRRQTANRQTLRSLLFPSPCLPSLDHSLQPHKFLQQKTRSSRYRSQQSTHHVDDERCSVPRYSLPYPLPPPPPKWPSPIPDSLS